LWEEVVMVFEKADLDRRCSMKGIKRTVRTFGKVLGHCAGPAGDRLLPYAEARRTIYVPTYRWVLEHKLAAEVAALRQLSDDGKTVLLLDYETNGDVADLSRPLSHASLVARFLGEVVIHGAV
jgi:hypothetical protein